jgi:hypothetical protein
VVLVEDGGVLGVLVVGSVDVEVHPDVLGGEDVTQGQAERAYTLQLVQV